MSKTKTFILVISIIGFLLAGCSNSNFQAETNYEVKDFNYTNQNGKEVSLKDLKGKVWIADFIFTNCETVCPPMTFNLTKLQEKLNEEGVEDYKIVSFSVDPENDTPEALKEYIANFDADTSKWDLLTGYEFDEVKDLAEHSFRSIVADDPNSDQMIHGTSFYLVNQEGIVVKTYSGNSDVPYDEMVQDMKTLIKEGT
ncbi:SCO family protein (plasmid) [Cytobacillus spongiae]|uniref:SCO family protein n=1 Tax=Cytobacillus spongiae TaxID=2901381 RepID=UPI00145F3275|nr:SCO family protein [Cytobacillus spongiae]MCA1062524.1 SCO family protein [Rossellomorea aquimaris]NMH71032.1 SCO family protein [Bacillus sp. RO3]UII58171.1 SCO family protein [Cytobacillus spongiae]WJV28790.1 SCO family protein [Rossellomorea sp. AcN35-11]